VCLEYKLVGEASTERFPEVIVRNQYSSLDVREFSLKLLLFQKGRNSPFSLKVKPLSLVCESALDCSFNSRY
jgi:hypothetical protein